MKKRILSVLLALMLVVSLVPNHVHAADECTHENPTIYKEIYGHYVLCNDCGVSTSGGWQEHTYPYGYEGDMCSVCGYTLCNNHVYADGACSLCGTLDPATCAHEHTQWQHTAPTESMTATHGQTCQDCDTVLVHGPHTLENGTCTVCGAAPCAGNVHTVGSAAYPHVCGDCGAGTGCRDANLDCKCDLCGEDWHSGYVYGFTETDHIKQCTVCDEVLLRGEHTRNDAGICTGCGDGCDHANGRWQSYDFGHVYWCDDCIYQVKWTEHHTFEGNVCTVCGFGCNHQGFWLNDTCTLCGFSCDHANANYEWYEETHSLFCGECGNYVVENEEHTVVVRYSEYDHYSICEVCEQYIQPPVPHDFEGDTCKGCGFRPCANGEHTSGPDHICTLCGMTTNCINEDDDCNCDICGEARFHNEMWERNESQHRRVCARCEADLSEGWHPHYISEGETICYECGYGCPHENVEYWREEDYHTVFCYDCHQEIAWEAHTVAWNHNEHGYHWSGCSVCGYYLTEWESHELDENGKCTVCGAKPCAYGTHTFGKDHICTACGAESGCRDENGDCACDICGVVIHGLEIREYNDTQHRTVCADCGKTTMEWTDHVYDEEGGCYDCGYGCEHASAECYNWDDYHVVHCNDCYYYIAVEEHSGTWTHNENGNHYQVCDDCNTWMDSGRHTLKDGVCTGCGAKPCAEDAHTPGKDHICTACGAETYCRDKNWNCVCDICEEKMHNYNRVENEEVHGWQCTTCGEYEWKEAHADSNGVGGCDSCGYGCKHPESEWDYNEALHVECCKDCGEALTEITGHNWKDGKCTDCGAEACKHEHTHWEIGDVLHSEICNACGLYITYPEEHTLKDGVCTACKTAPCAAGKHTLEKESHYCTTCEILLPCVDADGDCTCDWVVHEMHTDVNGDCTCDSGCGYVAHEYIRQHNDTQHWEQCFFCGDKKTAESHILVKGVCYECGFGCKHEDHETAGVLHTQHATICEICDNIYSIETHTDANGDRFCDVCGYADPHTPVKVEEVKATCTESGVKAHYYCKACSGIYSDAAGTVSVTVEELTIPAAHSYKDGVCTVCNAKDPLYVKVEVAEDVPEVKTELPVDDLLTEEDKAALAAGTAVKVELTVENVSQTVIEEHKVAIEELLTVIAKEKQEAVETGVNEVASVETVVVMYLDINLTKTVGDAQADAITETNSKIRITIDVPAEYRNAATGVAREFSVIRVHGDEVTELKDLDNDPNTVTFETDRFSTYALAYSDTKVEEENPKTGDSFEVLLAGLVAVSMLCAAAFVTGKRN